MRPACPLGCRSAGCGALRRGTRLDWWDRKNDGVARSDRDLLTHRRPVSADRIRDKTKRCQAAHYAGGNRKVCLAVPVRDAEAEALSAARSVDRHVEKALIVHLNHRGLIQV